MPGTGFLRRKRQDESAAEVQDALLEELFTGYAPQPCVFCSDCECVLKPEHISCRCEDCSVFRCHQLQSKTLVREIRLCSTSLRYLSQMVRCAFCVLALANTIALSLGLIAPY